MTETVFVRLLNEGIDVWRPVQAKRLPSGAHRIVDQPYDADIESWEFLPGSVVMCEQVETSDGSILAAARDAEETT